MKLYDISLSDDHIQQDEMAGECERTAERVLVGTPQRNSPLARPRRSWEEDISES
jgi:hypothetical protein